MRFCLNLPSKAGMQRVPSATQFLSCLFQGAQNVSRSTLRIRPDATHFRARSMASWPDCMRPAGGVGAVP